MKYFLDRANAFSFVVYKISFLENLENILICLENVEN
jgi:hypothetical protein